MRQSGKNRIVYFQDEWVFKISISKEEVTNDFVISNNIPDIVPETYLVKLDNNLIHKSDDISTQYILIQKRLLITGFEITQILEQDLAEDPAEGLQKWDYTLKYWDKKYWNIVFDYFCENSNEICLEDIHLDNIMFDKDGKPWIIDVEQCYFEGSWFDSKIDPPDPNQILTENQLIDKGIMIPWNKIKEDFTIEEQ